jgi:serine/threonine protein kinase/tetratricopeptide (TPR) repeat protein
MLQRDDVQLRELLMEAADLPPGRRAAFLDSACDGDEPVRREIESLLEKLQGELLDEPAPAAGAATTPATMTRIGRYRLLDKIGEGGMGAVYKAQQDRPVRRTVALKLIKPGMDTKQVIARFDAERQALALMEHPHIARVYDAGSTELGRPYFVMEFVAGEPITGYCDRRKLTIRRRLELFIKVCQAVQHAHQKGVIHRDLKPSNVLVSEQDGEAVPKVIDFGIAKATQGRLIEQTVTATAEAHWVGTPQYMSPEQANGGANVDTRSDVYMLGVLLYELLCGVTPFGGEELAGKTPYDVQRLIRDVEPRTPSNRVKTQGPAVSAIGGCRDAEPKQLAKVLRGDLDCIVMKCLEKDRGRRYETVNGLARDIERYLASEPVEAAPPSVRYRIGRFVRRHRVGVAGGTAVAVAVLIGVIGLSVGLSRATKESNKAQALNKFMTGIFNRAQPGEGGNLKVVELLRLASKDIDKTLRDQPEAQIDARETLGETFYRLGLGPEAQSEFERAHALSMALDRGHTSARTLRAAHWLAMCLDDLSPPGDLRCIAMARQTYLEAVRVLGESHPVSRVATASYARLLVLHDQPVEAEPILRKLLAQPPPDPATDLIPKGVMVDNLALALIKEGRIGTEAADLLRGNIKSLRAELGSGSRSGSHPLVGAEMYLAFILAHQGKQEEAMECLREATVDAGRMFGSLHEMTQWTIDAYAHALSRTDRFDAARDVLDERLRLIRAEQSGDGDAQVDTLIQRGLLHVRRHENGGIKFILDGVEMEQRVRKDVQPRDYEALRLAMLGELGSWKHGSDGRVAAQVYCALDEMLRENPARLIELAGKMPLAVRYQLRRETLDVVSEGALEELPANLDVEAGLYRLTLEATGAQGSESASPSPLRATQWLLVVPWKVSVCDDHPESILPFYARQESPAIEEQWWAQRLAGGAAVPTGTSKSLAMMSALGSSPAPAGREEDFGIVANCSIDLPRGKYRFIVTCHDGIRLYVDRRPVIDDWTWHFVQRESADVELSGGQHELRVEYFHTGGPYKLWVRVEPLK